MKVNLSGRASLDRNLTQKEISNINILYKYATIVIDYIISNQDPESEAYPGGNKIIAQMKPIIDLTYKKNDLRGLKTIVKDFKDMFSGFTKEEKSEINHLFIEQKLEAWPY